MVGGSTRVARGCPARLWALAWPCFPLVKGAALARRSRRAVGLGSRQRAVEPGQEPGPFIDDLSMWRFIYIGGGAWWEVVPVLRHAAAYSRSRTVA